MIIWNKIIECWHGKGKKAANAKAVLRKKSEF
jgi:hypothetical protein